jgi:hypothetical protein
MGKLKLSLEHLAVETFTTEKPAADARGTVHARESFYETWEDPTCGQDHTCANWNTCNIDCTMLCSFHGWPC